jgi:hypothetical protein
MGDNAIDRRRDLRLVGGFEEEAVSSSRRDPIDERGEISDPRRFAEVVTRAKNRRSQRRHLALKRGANGLRKPVGRLHQNVDQEFTPRQSGLLSLALKLANRLFDALAGVFAHPAPPIQNAIDRRFAETGLESNFLDEKRVRHGRVGLDGFLMD